MRVDQSTSNQVQGSDVSSASKTGKAAAAERAKKSQKAQEYGASSSSDSVKTDISAKGKEFAKAKAVATSAPDIREDKIAELKKRISEGKYKVDAQAVADKMFDDHLSMADIG